MSPIEQPSPTNATSPENDTPKVGSPVTSGVSKGVRNFMSTFEKAAQTMRLLDDSSLNLHHYDESHARFNHNKDDFISIKSQKHDEQQSLQNECNTATTARYSAKKNALTAADTLSTALDGKVSGSSVDGIVTKEEVIQLLSNYVTKSDLAIVKSENEILREEVANLRSPLATMQFSTNSQLESTVSKTFLAGQGFVSQQELSLAVGRSSSQIDDQPVVLKTLQEALEAATSKIELVEAYLANEKRSGNPPVPAENVGNERGEMIKVAEEVFDADVKPLRKEIKDTFDGLAQEVQAHTHNIDVLKNHVKAVNTSMIALDKHMNTYLSPTFATYLSRLVSNNVWPEKQQIEGELLQMKNNLNTLRVQISQLSQRRGSGPQVQPVFSPLSQSSASGPETQAIFNPAFPHHQHHHT